MEERFKEILEGGDRCELIDFLLSLNSKEKKEIQTLLKSMMSIDESRAYYLRTYSYLEGRSYSEQKQLLSLLKCAVVMLFGVRDIKKLHLPITLGEIKDVLYRYKPRWLEGDLSKNSWSSIISSITYNDLVDLYKKGVISYDKELFAKYIELSFEFFDKVKDKHRFAKDDLWLAFEYGNYISDVKECYALLERVESDFDVDRLYILDKILLGVKDVDTIYIKSYWELFASFKPTDIELLVLIDTLFVLLDSGSARLVKPTLRYIKSIIELDGFDVAGFIQRVPKIISLDNKSIVNDIFVISNKIAKMDNTKLESLSLALLKVLEYRDEKIEHKYINFLDRYNQLYSEKILKAISCYSQQLFSSTKSKLPHFKVVDRVDVGVIEKEYIEDDKLIIYPDSFDELIRLFLEILENRYVNGFELFLSNILRLDKIIDSSNVDRFLVVISKAESLAHSYHYNEGLVLYICIDLILKYADKLALEYDCIDRYIKGRAREKPYLSTILQKPYFYKVHYHLSLLVYDKLRSVDRDELLSTPTHNLAYISDRVLIERLIKVEEIDVIDFQIALLRVVISGDIKSLIDKVVDREIADILLYLSGDIEFDLNLIKREELWVVALLRRGDIEDIERFALRFDRLVFPYKIPRYSIGDIIYDYDKNTYTTKYLKPTNGDRKIVNINPDFVEKDVAITNIFSMIFDRNRNYTLHSSDEQKFLLLAPFAYDYILLFFLNINGYDFGFTRANSTRNAKEILSVWREFYPIEMREYSYIYLLASMLAKEVEIREEAWGLYNQMVLAKKIDNNILGDKLAEFISRGYAPIKRFSDMLAKVWIKESKIYLNELFKMLSVVLLKLSDTPPRGIKKVLELYLEVIISLDKTLPKELKGRLEVWNRISSLKSITKRLIDTLDSNLKRKC